MGVTTKEEKDHIIELYTNGASINAIALATGRCKATVKSILRGAGMIMSTTRLKEADVQYIKRHFPGRQGWNIPEPKPKVSKYRIVHPGDKGIRTPDRPDGRFR